MIRRVISCLPNFTVGSWAAGWSPAAAAAFEAAASAAVDCRKRRRDSGGASGFMRSSSKADIRSSFYQKWARGMPSHPVPSQFQSEAAKIWRMKHTVAAGLVAVSLGMAAEVRLTNDSGGGYVSVYTMATGIPYTDAVLQECS